MKKGFILAYSLSVNAGVIEGDDGNTYAFPKEQWHGLLAPVKNGLVSFMGSSHNATSVYSG